MKEEGVQVGCAAHPAEEQGGEEERCGAGPEAVSHGSRKYNLSMPGGSSLAPGLSEAKFRPLDDANPRRQ
jgi:hypothetical protein